MEEIVVVKVKRIVDMGAYVQLLEYNGKEGMLLLSELTKRRIRSYSKLLRIGRTEISMVVRVDAEKGYLDLSKRKVDPEAAAAKEESFAKAKAVHSIMRHVAGQSNVDVEDLCMKTSWPLHKKHGSAYDVFHKHVDGELNVWDEVDFSRPGRDLSSIAAKLKADIELHMRRRLVQRMLQLRAKVEVSCPEYDGIEAVKEALMEGLRASKEGCEVKIKLLASPLFSVSCSCRDKEFGMALLSESANFIKESIESKGGAFFLRSGPDIAGRDEENDYPDEEFSDPGSFTGSDSEQDETMGGLTAQQEAALNEDRGGDSDEDDAAADQAVQEVLDRPS